MFNKRYKIIKQIGKGGMSKVYLAKQLDLDRNVAVKIMDESIINDEESVKRFFREARIMARLSHPNIVSVIESDFDKKRPYIITEYLDGGDFKNLIKYSNMKLKKKLLILLKILDALNYAHSKGIVHRDLKPSNILLTKEMEPKLSDFGIAAILYGDESRLTKSNEVMGTIDYMSPEQKNNAKNLDHRSDIFSFGIILYELLTGRMPQGVFKEPNEIIKSIPDSLNNLVMKCLEYEPVDRFENVLKLKKELEYVIKEIDIDIKGNISLRKTNDFTEIKDSGSFDEIYDKLKKGTLTEKILYKEEFLKSIKKEHFEKLVNELLESDGLLKETIIEALAKIDDKRACKYLVELLSDTEYLKSITEAIGILKCENSEEILLKLLTMNSEYSYHAIYPLGQLKSKRAVKHIAKFLNNEHSWIRIRAIESLAKIKTEEALDYIRNISKRDKDDEVRTIAKKILWRFKL